MAERAAAIADELSRHVLKMANAKLAMKGFNILELSDEQRQELIGDSPVLDDFEKEILKSAMLATRDSFLKGIHVRRLKIFSYSIRLVIVCRISGLSCTRPDRVASDHQPAVNIPLKPSEGPSSSHRQHCISIQTRPPRVLLTHKNTVSTRPEAQPSSLLL